MAKGVLIFPNGDKRHISAPDLLDNLHSMYDTEDKCHDGFIENCDKISTLHDNLAEKTKKAMIAATRMGDKVNSKLFGDEAYEGDDSYVDEDDMDYDDTDDIDMPNSSVRQLQLMPSSTTLDTNEVSNLNVQPKSNNIVHVNEKNDSVLGS